MIPPEPRPMPTPLSDDRGDSSGSVKRALEIPLALSLGRMQNQTLLVSELLCDRRSVSVNRSVL